jgi:hypothetical protein
MLPPGYGHCGRRYAVHAGGPLSAGKDNNQKMNEKWTKN